MNNDNNAPAVTLRDGALKASIWRNEGEKGPWYQTKITRIYKDGTGNYHETPSFTGVELLRAARLAERAYDYIQELIEQNRKIKDQKDAA